MLLTRAMINSGSSKATSRMRGERVSSSRSSKYANRDGPMTLANDDAGNDGETFAVLSLSKSESSTGEESRSSSLLVLSLSGRFSC